MAKAYGKRVLTFLMLISLMVVILNLVSTTEAQRKPRTDVEIVKGLSWSFYQKACPKLESIIQKELKKVFKRDIGLAAAILRIHFHDCFVQGCEASVLLAGSASGPGEQSSIPNLTLRQAAFVVINNLRAIVHKQCGQVVSCSDILALAARDSVVLVIPNLASRESFERHLAEYMAAQGPFDGDSTPSYAQLYTFMTHNASQVQPTTPRSTRSSNPGIQCSEPIPHMTLDELLLTPNRHRLRQLDPDRKDGATWFKHDPSTKITKAILRMMKSYLNKPYATYRNMPYEEKEAWLIAFAQEFNWDPIHTPAVREAFEIQAKASFSTNVHGWKHRWQTKQGKPDWFNDNLWKGYVKLWRKEDVVAKAAQNSLNRRSERGGDGIAKHHTGSKTYERRKDELTVLNGGEEPSMLALLEDVHKNKKTGVISDGKAQRIIQTCKTQIQQSQSVRQSQQSTDGGVEGSIVMSQSEINKLVLDMTPKVKGRRFGFGTLSDAVGSSSTTFSGSKEKELRLANEENVQLREKVSYLTEVIEKVLNRFPEFVPNRPNPDTIDG